MAGRTDAKFDRIVNGSDSDDNECAFNRTMYKRHMFYKKFLVSKSTQTEPVIVISPQKDVSWDNEDDAFSGYEDKVDGV